MLNSLHAIRQSHSPDLKRPTESSKDDENFSAVLSKAKAALWWENLPRAITEQPQTRAFDARVHGESLYALLSEIALDDVHRQMD